MSRENEPKARFALPVTAEEYTGRRAAGRPAGRVPAGASLFRGGSRRSAGPRPVFLTGAALAFFRR